MTFGETFIKKLVVNFKGLLPWRIFGLPIVVLVIFLINDAPHAIDAYVLLLKSPVAWGVWIAGVLLDAAINAMYWTARERKPIYIKKMKAQEEALAEKSKTNSKTGKHSLKDGDDRL